MSGPNEKKIPGGWSRPDPFDFESEDFADGEDEPFTWYVDPEEEKAEQEPPEQ